VSVPDDLIDKWLSHLLGQSSPGDVLHHLLVAVADPADQNAFGMPDPDKLQLKMYAIAPTGGVDTDNFIAKQIIGATIEATNDRQLIHFAALGVEYHRVVMSDGGGDEVFENQVRRMQADRKLHEHPKAVEMTQLYAACRDGRRWTGRHYLTGDMAGTIIGPDLRVGALAPDERGLHPKVIRAAVRHGL
jgi:hypothetical protein